ncbi:hypothetical protein GALMADRAFT_133554 [Galerina marginata CBS 339.88]|uniref:Uncharacterized protein n=1 Tax=Galerina marginata (strain CBS 339.88) TaxID=685588 RepID=A0A067TPE3_GALM3|nr:hypothetical protein GALMADRAFT_133554 [Galerina marginata CBS 339.88]
MLMHDIVRRQYTTLSDSQRPGSADAYMGRHAKYLTADEHANAALKARQKYALTDRAKAIRSAQNHRAYVKRTEAKQLTLKLPKIPRSVRTAAALPLPRSSPLFQRVFNILDNLTDDADFAGWEHPPPYSVSPYLLEFGLEETIDALHARRLRMQCNDETARLERYKKSPLETFQTEIHTNVLKVLEEWQELGTLLKGCRSSQLDTTMGNHLLQWKARRLVALVEDWKALKQGKDGDKFLSLYLARWS